MNLKDTVAKLPFGGTMAVVVGMVEGVAGEALKAVPIPGRKGHHDPATQVAPTDAASEPDQA